MKVKVNKMRVKIIKNAFSGELEEERINNVPCGTDKWNDLD